MTFEECSEIDKMIIYLRLLPDMYKKEIIEKIIKLLKALKKVEELVV